MTGGSIIYSPEGKAPEELVGKTPMEIKDAGVALAFVPEDRLGMGLVGGMGMTGNMLLRSWNKGKGIFIDRKAPEQLAEQVLENLEVKTPDIDYPVRKLSGGNVQKVLVGREIASAPSVLMSAYAVRGLDIHTSYTIYNLMTEQKKKGLPLSLSARIWTYCLSSAIKFLSSAVVGSPALWMRERRARKKSVS